MNIKKKKEDLYFFKNKNLFLFLKLNFGLTKKLKRKKRNFCSLNKRKRSFIRFFGLNRNSLKELFGQEVLPGLKKSSW